MKLEEKIFNLLNGLSFCSVLTNSKTNEDFEKSIKPEYEKIKKKLEEEEENFNFLDINEYVEFLMYRNLLSAVYVYYFSKKRLNNKNFEIAFDKALMRFIKESTYKQKKFIVLKDIIKLIQATKKNFKDKGIKFTNETTVKALGAYHISKTMGYIDLSCPSKSQKDKIDYILCGIEYDFKKCEEIFDSIFDSMLVFNKTQEIMIKYDNSVNDEMLN